MDKLNAMATFVQIVERGSLTQAAEALNTSLPTVVRVLAALEESLGVRLLNRTTRRIALTVEGRSYLERCQRILTDIRDAEQSLLAQQQVPSGKLLVTAPLLFGQMHVAPAATQFISRYPEVQIELRLIDRVINLIDEGVDVAIRIGHLADSSLIAIPVGRIRQVVCATPAYLQKVGTPLKPGDLTEHKCIRLTAATSSHSWTFREKGKIIQVPITSSFTCNQAAVAIDACTQGLGFGSFLSYQVQHLVGNNELTVVLKEFELDPMPINIVYPHAKLLSSRVRMFVDWALERLQESITTR